VAEAAVAVVTEEDSRKEMEKKNAHVNLKRNPMVILEANHKVAISRQKKDSEKAGLTN